MATAITKWKTKDGKEFNSAPEAVAHEDFVKLSHFFPGGPRFGEAAGSDGRVYAVLTSLLRAGHVVIPGAGEKPDV
jgi:hypothetical protein